MIKTYDLLEVFEKGEWGSDSLTLYGVNGFKGCWESSEHGDVSEF